MLTVRNIGKATVAVAIAVLLFVVGCTRSGSGDDSEKTEQDKVSLMRDLQKCSRIYTSEYQVSKIVIHKEEKRIHGKLLGIPLNIGIAGGKRVIAIPIMGIVKGYVDMGELKEENVIRHGDSIEIILPDPHIELTGTQISGKEIREKVGLLQHNFSDEELTELQRQGRDSLISEIPKLGITDNARLSAARLLTRLLTGMGYDESKIKITFRRDYNITPDIVRDMFTNTLL